MNLFSFQGRIGRGAYWLQGLVIVVAYLVISFLIGEAFNFQFTVTDTTIEVDTSGISAIGWLVILAATIAYAWVFLALYAKRWHDRGKSGWWSLISLIPVIGSLSMFIELGFLPGTPGPNQYDTEHQAVSF